MFHLPIVQGQPEGKNNFPITIYILRSLIPERQVCTNTTPRPRAKNQKEKTCNSRYSLVITDPTTNQPHSGLTVGERTGSRVSHWVWSYVRDLFRSTVYDTCNQQRSCEISKGTHPRRWTELPQDPEHHYNQPMMDICDCIWPV